MLSCLFVYQNLLIDLHGMKFILWDQLLWGPVCKRVACVHFGLRNALLCPESICQRTGILSVAGECQWIVDGQNQGSSDLPLLPDPGLPDSHPFVRCHFYIMIILARTHAYRAKEVDQLDTNKVASRTSTYHLL